METRFVTARVRVRALIVLFLVASASAAAETTLPGTAPLESQSDLAADMVAGIGRFFDRKLAESVEARQRRWHMDFASPESYAQSVEANRAHLATILGVVDKRVAADADADLMQLVTERPEYTIHAVRWPVWPGVDTEGLLLQPKGDAASAIVAVPDADESPELLAGLTGDMNHAYAVVLAKAGFRVFIPVVIDRDCRWSGNPRIRMTNQPHREWIYRMSFEVGRHIIGYEVQKVLAAVDRLALMQAATQGGARHGAIGVVGYGEGGLIVFCAAALDARIEFAGVSGYFQPREGVWQEPIYRNVWGLLEEFGDAEIARLIAPRRLMIEASEHPQIDGPPNPLQSEGEAAPGRIATPELAAVRREFARARTVYEKLNAADRCVLIEPAEDNADPLSRRFLQEVLGSDRGALPEVGVLPHDLRGKFNPVPRLHRQFDQLVSYSQRLLRESPWQRQEFWKKADRTSVEQWEKSTQWYRDYVHDEVIGRLEPASVPANPRSRRILDEPKFVGYEVMLDVWPEVFAYGVLLVPKDLQPGGRRPVVVCQHGLEGRPDKVIDPRITGLYNSFGAKLADQGFVVFAPQNPYIGGDSFRILQRKANPLKKSLFSVITRQHERILEWLGTQPFVDAERIGFYGISYGGKTAMRVPVLLPQYALSICSADFNEYALKVASVDYPFGFMFVQEYEIPEWNLADTFNHAELAGLIAPRPFMVERGYKDPVAPDEWVAFEYAKARRLYVDLGIADRAEIEWFAGGHEIHAVGTFAFLHRHLNWPAK